MLIRAYKLIKNQKKNFISRSITSLSYRDELRDRLQWDVRKSLESSKPDILKKSIA